MRSLLKIRMGFDCLSMFDCSLLVKKKMIPTTAFHCNIWCACFNSLKIRHYGYCPCSERVLNSVYVTLNKVFAKCLKCKCESDIL